jgi:large subunit ribosomal protein L31
MKKNLHPEDYRLMVIQDTSDGSTFLTHSTAKTEETIKWTDGKEYPLFKVHISSTSHPFFTGQEKLVDVEGRVDRFKARQKRAEEFRLASQQRKSAPTVKKAVKPKKSPEVPAEPATEEMTPAVSAEAVEQAAESASQTEESVPDPST